MEILIKRINETAKLPVYSREVGAGIELYANEEVVVEAGARVIIGTGIAMALPVGYVGLICNQYSTIVNESIKVASGMMDSGNREEIKIEVINSGAEERTFLAGEKIASLLIQQIYHPSFIEAEDLGGSK